MNHPMHKYFYKKKYILCCVRKFVMHTFFNVQLSLLDSERIRRVNALTILCDFFENYFFSILST